MQNMEQEIQSLNQRVLALERQIVGGNIQDFRYREKEFFRVGEASRALGLSIGTIQKMTNTGVLPFIKSCGGQRLIRKSDLLNYINQATDHHE